MRWRCSATMTNRARRLRGQMTGAEQALWRRIRGGQLGGHQFRRQHPVGRYVLDFFCTRAGLAIEIDGDSHAVQRVYDERRTRWLEQNKGYRVLRFTNFDVLSNIDGVLQSILEILDSTPVGKDSMIRRK